MDAPQEVRALINDDMRYTFTRPTPRVVYRKPKFRVPPSDTFALFDLKLPPDLYGCDRLFVEAAMTRPLSPDPHSVVRTMSTAVEQTIGDCVGTPLTTNFVVAVPAPPILRDHDVDLSLYARRMPEQGVSERRIHLDLVPEQARFTVSYGVESEGWARGAGAVEFRVIAEGQPAPLFQARLEPLSHPEERRWFDASVDLTAYAGKPLTLVLQTRPDRGLSGLSFSAPVWGNPMLLARSTPTPPSPRNLLLISIDTLRARSLGAYGAQEPTSPFFDELASKSVLFEQAISHAPTTTASHMSLFTSLYPSSHGVGTTTLTAKTSFTTLAEILREHGYATSAATEDGMLAAAYGFERGFDRYLENKSADLMTPQGHIEQTFRDAMAWMTENRARPFFMFVHTYQVHDPYTPPAAYLGRFGPVDGNGPEADRDRYEEEIRYTDDQLAGLWAHIRELGLDDNTIVVITSDHGEEFGEHGALRHSAHLYEEGLAVPLLIHTPASSGGVRVREQVGLIDVVPTVLDLLGLEPLPQAQGVSLAAFFGDDANSRAALAARLDQRRIYAEAWGAGRYLVDRTWDPTWRAPQFALRSGQRKLIWTPAATNPDREARLEVYNLVTDPQERSDLASADGTSFASDRAELERYAGAGTPATTADTLTMPLPADPAVVEKLRALGYLQ